ncbi:type II toxin-antitoxin system VapC family toxin [Pleomorphomonas carboxyditropha]|uniref:Ribonuclease VapC n=1 Tax=Pleomorphomonas carboxyditropha TaxID=2023338 RepID=A0A2G9WPC2_9HYPH|nr:type II toxin-antitoxin system VapC family toxin [Pleomorphomonas carboxyditropha]PIO96557.1 VapC toxin family PIN domain ribonuclease [Pleomorphomonas carboxyditropha]
MRFLLDTNIISEIRKQERCDANVMRWFRAVDSGSLFLSVLVIGEIRRGAEMLRERDLRRFEAIDHWLADVKLAFEGRILDIDATVAEEWGRLGMRRSLPVIDGLLAATARIHALTLVTRNTSDVADLDIALINPFLA